MEWLKIRQAALGLEWSRATRHNDAPASESSGEVGWLRKGTGPGIAHISQYVCASPGPELEVRRSSYSEQVKEEEVSGKI